VIYQQVPLSISLSIYLSISFDLSSNYIQSHNKNVFEAKIFKAKATK